MKYFVYRVYYYEDASFNNYTVLFEDGVVAAENAVEATSNVYNDFGEANIVSVSLHKVDTDCKCVAHIDIAAATEDFNVLVGDEIFASAAATKYTERG